MVVISVPDCVGWFEHGDLSPGPVSSWNDLSGNGNHATQGTLSQQPVKDAAGVLFDGLDDNLRIDSVASVFSGSDNDYTVFLVAKPTLAIGARTMLGIGSSTSLLPIVQLRLNGDKLECYRRGDASESLFIQQAAKEPETTGTAVYAFRFNGTETTAWSNGCYRLTAGQDMSALTANRVALGCLARATNQNFWSGHILAVAIFSRALSFPEIREVQAYLSGKFLTDPITDDRIANVVPSWWCLPRAAVYNGKVWTGGSRGGNGDILLSGSGTDGRVVLRGDWTPPDDHRTPAILMPQDRVPVVFYTGHNDDAVLRWRKGESVGSFDSLGAEQTVSASALATYVQAYNRPGTDEGILFSRVGTTTWRLWRTTDHFETVGQERTFIDFGANQQAYIATRQLSNGTLRVAAYGHPTASAIRDIFYCEVNLETGAITKRDGTVLGNIDGTNLPLSHTDLDLVYDVPLGEGSRLFDVSDGPQIELAFATWTTDSDAVYRYARWDGTGWSVRDVITAGASFGYTPSIHYNGGMSFPDQSPGGVVYLARENGTWTIEKHVTSDGGASWAPTVIVTAPSGHKYVRPYVVGGHLVYVDLFSYPATALGYEQFMGDLRIIPCT